MTSFLRRFGITLALIGFASILPAAVRAECPTDLIVDWGAMAWGSSGNGDGEFNRPAGVATDPAGFVYVADFYNHRIQKFTGAGVYVSQWGSFGSGDGQFNYPYGVATDPAGNVYISDTGNYRIEKFDADGNFILKWGSFGSGDGQFNRVLNLTTDGAGDVYIADFDNHRIQKFDGNGNFLLKWGSFGTSDGQFEFPYGVATDAAGDVYVSEYDNHRVQKFDGDGTFLLKWGTFGSGDGQLNQPSSLATDASGDVYVTDQFNNRFQKFTGTGAYVCQFPAPVVGGIATDGGGGFYASSLYAHRMQKFAHVTNDHVPPVITCPGDIALQCVPLSGTAVVFSVTATDAEDLSPEISCSLPSGSVFPVGETIVTCTATDDAGNAASCAFTVVLSSDSEHPSISPPQDVIAVASYGEAGCGAVIDDAALGVATGSDNCPGPVTVARTGVPPASFFPPGTTEITYTARDAAGNESATTQTIIVTEPAGSIAGHALAACPLPASPLFGLKVDAFDNTGTLIGTAVTDEDGAYVIESLASPAAYTVSVITPLGYQAIDEDRQVAITCGRRETIDFSFTCLPIEYNPRTQGFWKHQVGVATGGPGSAQVSASELCSYLDLIDGHFNGNAINSVRVYEPPASGLCEDKLQEAKRLLNLHGSAAMLARARQQLMALLLNVSAGYMSVTQVVSLDGATLSQAITYCDLLIDAPPASHELAKTIADRINNGQLVAAGLIPLDTQDISYRQLAEPVVTMEPFRSSSNPGVGERNFLFHLEESGPVTLELFDAAGRLVGTPFAGTLKAGPQIVAWDGRGTGGDRVDGGIYFTRLTTHGRSPSKMIKLVLVNR